MSDAGWLFYIGAGANSLKTGRARRGAGRLFVNKRALAEFSEIEQITVGTNISYGCTFVLKWKAVLVRAD